jgi:hypothetical protein
MAKRTNRVVWRLATGLAVGMLGGTGLLFHDGGPLTLSVGHTAVRLRPLSHWQVGWITVYWIFAPGDTQITCLGFFSVLVDRSSGPVINAGMQRYLDEWTARESAAPSGLVGGNDNLEAWQMTLRNRRRWPGAWAIRRKRFARPASIKHSPARLAISHADE